VNEKLTFLCSGNFVKDLEVLSGNLQQQSSWVDKCFLTLANVSMSLLTGTIEDTRSFYCVCFSG